MQFIEVWRQKQEALQTNKLTNLLLSNARHEGLIDLSFMYSCPLTEILVYSSHTSESYHQVGWILVTTSPADIPHFCSSVIWKWLLTDPWTLRQETI